MSEIDYYNGFVCGMATRGMIRSGQSYSPNVFNDPGQTGYFYIEFRQSLNSFSFGMLTESIQVLGLTNAIPITDFEMVSPSRVKIMCSIAGQESITVVGMTGGWLSFSAGGKVPGFSASFVVEGIVSFPKTAYAYETLEIHLEPLQCLTDTNVKFAGYYQSPVEESVILALTPLEVIGKVTVNFYAQ